MVLAYCWWLLFSSACVAVCSSLCFSVVVFAMFLFLINCFKICWWVDLSGRAYQNVEIHCAKPLTRESTTNWLTGLLCGKAIKWWMLAYNAYHLPHCDVSCCDCLCVPVRVRICIVHMYYVLWALCIMQNACLSTINIDGTCCTQTRFQFITYFDITLILYRPM